jgi:DeoR/GlpR family transcriptional regulator of sugar metabolism
VRIFMSHSSRQKLFVKELRRQLPASIALWIDEHEILMGSNLESRIREGISLECDFFILVIDQFALGSEWVAKEVAIAVEREKQLGRTFLLPIVLEPEAWEEVTLQGLRGRKYLACTDFSDETIAALARTLTSEILEWLTRLLDHQHGRGGSSEIDVIQEAERLTNKLADDIKTLVLPYREGNPLAIDRLVTGLRERGIAEGLDRTSLLELLGRLNGRQLLNGIQFDDEYIFLSQERYSFKSSIHLTIKKKIARRAVSLVQPGWTLAVDGGSTALELVKLICGRIRGRTLYNLTIITNSLPAAYELLAALSDMGANDYDKIAQVFIAGTLCRPVSMTVVPGYHVSDNPAIQVEVPNVLDSILHFTGPPDIAFVGSNGIFRNMGFANHNRYEIDLKRQMIQTARRKYILVDPSKFAIEQNEPFAWLSQSLNIITAHDPEYATAIATFVSIVSETSSSIEVLP